ncbi:hypothetical protein Ddc_11913 [Ditylenchus destructor]|nr:hypothetical protein Ddc_11913 [Ditylenchus destructor]
MWYESIIWCSAVTMGFVQGALYIWAPANWFTVGRWQRRQLETPNRTWMLKRDHRLTGNMYILNTLDSIKDEDEKPVPNKFSPHHNLDAVNERPLLWHAKRRAAM